MSMPTFDEILAENGKSVFGPGGQSHIWRDYLGTVGEVPSPGEGEFVDGMSKWPYLANPLDRFFGMSNQELKSQVLKHSQPDQHGKLQLDKEHTLTAFQARQTLEALDRLKDTTFSITCSFHFPHSPMLAPEPFYGVSLQGLIEGSDTIHGSYVVTELKDGWKLMIPYTISSPVLNALYDLNTDPRCIPTALPNVI